ncbi:hypothetical protein [Bradyrhizobium japonicum]|uniref:hypothetical protein n=1 Tax=Bradyrhizobium japonicum TaxID=375 RepID=UPI0012699F3D|nr:hypothetical protein [Bradyrhizobium japonicum]
MSTPLHQRMLAFDHGNAECAALMERVWRDTPWMVDVYSGGYSRDRDREHSILMWCYEQFGEQCSVIHGRSGRWQRGSATIDGWTWFGFSTEAEMKAFVDRWPTPKGVSVPQ